MPFTPPDFFHEAGCVGWLCVERLEDGRRLESGAATLVVAASVIKLLVAVEAEHQMECGALDATERVLLRADDRTDGPTGISVLHDDVEISLRDLVVLMLTISDNSATDALLQRLGLDAVNAAASRLEMASTAITADLRATIASIGLDAGFADFAALSAWLDVAQPGAQLDEVLARVRASRSLTAGSANHTTPSDMVLLLRHLWTDQAASPAACGRVRAIMRRQLTRHRLAAGFAVPARVAAKSGGLMGIVRNEVGVVEYPDGDAYLVAIFTEAARAGEGGAEIDAAIGRTAAHLVALLRSDRSSPVPDRAHVADQ